MKTADQMAKNYQTGMASAGANYTAGVQGVTTAPTAAAATPDAEARYLAGVQQSVANGTRNAALQAVSLQQWQQMCISKGASRLTSGAAAAQAKVAAHFQKWAGTYQQASDAAKAVSKSDPLGRVRASINVLRAAAGKPTI